MPDKVRILGYSKHNLMVYKSRNNILAFILGYFYIPLGNHGALYPCILAIVETTVGYTPLPGSWLLTRVLLKIQNTSEQTVFAHVSERIDAVMHAKRLGSKFRHFFAIEPLTS